MYEFLKMPLKIVAVLIVGVILIVLLIAVDIYLTRSNCDYSGYEYGVTYKSRKIEISTKGCIKMGIFYSFIDIKLDSVNESRRLYFVDSRDDSVVYLQNAKYVIYLDTLLSKYDIDTVKFILSGWICAEGGLSIWPLNCTDYDCRGYIDVHTDSIVLCYEGM